MNTFSTGFNLTDHLHVSVKEYTNSNIQLKDDRDFEDLIDQVRTSLYKQSGKNEEDQAEYNKELNLAVMGFEEYRNKFRAKIESILLSLGKTPTIPYKSFNSLTDAVFAKVIGLDVIDPYIQSGEYEEVQVNGLDVFLVKNGETKKAPVMFESYKDVDRIKDNLVLFNAERIDKLKPEAEVIMPDGSRVKLTINPFTREPQIAFRMFPDKLYTIDDLVKFGTMNDKMTALIDALLFGRATGAIIGDTNAGKTTTIKAFLARIYDRDLTHRIVSIGSDFEIDMKKYIPHANFVAMQYLDEIGYTGAKSFRSILRMTPKRIFAQEIRDEDANEWVRAVLRGHSGSWTGLHCSAIKQIPYVLAEMITQDGRNQNIDTLERRIANLIDVGVQQEHLELKDGSFRRIITRISELDYQDGEVIERDLCVFNYLKECWEFPNMMSKELAIKIFRNDRKSFYRLVEIGLAVEDWLNG